VKKFGPGAAADLDDPNSSLKLRFRAAGLVNNYIPGSRIGNSFNFHRLMHLAGEASYEIQNNLQEVIFRKYFGEGGNPGETAMLADAAAEVSGFLTKEQATQFLESNKHSEEVRKLLAIPRQRRINGVPHFKFPNVELSGAQPIETFVEILTEIKDYWK